MSRTITNLDQVTEFPLCWPPDKPRAAKRETGTPFNTSMAKAAREIEEEMKRWRVRGYVVSMAPRHRQGAIDPGVAVWFNMSQRRQGGPSELRVIACDHWPWREDNLHAIALTLERLRSMERYGTYSLWQAIEGARPALPPPASAEPSWWDVLGVKRDWPLAAVEAIWRAKAEKAHPDRGGSVDEMARLNAAMDVARKEIG